MSGFPAYPWYASSGGTKITAGFSEESSYNGQSSFETTMTRLWPKLEPGWPVIGLCKDNKRDTRNVRADMPY